MSDEDALLAAICADPADDTARLAFADLLDEHGGAVEAAWAKFIRAHLRLGTGVELPGDVPTVMELGSDAWAGRFAARIGFPPGGEVAVGGWERGFPGAVVGAYPALRAGWDALAARVPFRQLRVLEADDTAVEDLVLWPRLDRLTALDLTTWDGFRPDDVPAESAVAAYWPLGARGVAAVCACPALGGLDALGFAVLEVTDRVADLILNSRPLRRLRELRIQPAGPWTVQMAHAGARLEARFGPGACGRRW